MENLNSILREVRNCKLCEAHLPLGANPVLSINSQSKILIIGQAPGTKVHATGIPWNDPSGDELRRWLDVDKNAFYDPEIFGIMPMGFCYPGRGRGGDLPPRKECAPTWHSMLSSQMPNLKLILLIGAFAQSYYLGERRKNNLTETVKNFKEYLPNYFPLVHPSPRNRLWMRKNPWFETEVLPELRDRVLTLI
ncbi:MAG TPA: IclR family transcriptional regulator [Algoriphagus sp.]|jgi:uracil-DNA glycosylase|uniref:uracil-DNA glycosylase family protein n=1 Tax=unclassified Algoriphagus TaxID=2641541 RepID=UPI000C672173|nr:MULTISPECIES: uracil-DNA glycosylase family protein [unclassified Algoriphagus]MAL15503.1 IclR family transcriptional regulator [Algoriphagus sp.]HAD52135.1 IclR family transcriptional regulator [Algoriphagus sp.]HAH38626.1 IclR family transcriptional regulator [Algoriphagus sp.]HAS57556.1 IclR family transcriptional regulator [Algoriphagus sp.]HCB46379.1 IclR family transcriptional regulator [Algoriphagus sp.]|tara:strand:+ start:15404 stop:15982 length:579 start_codon:yes stop_codon:yes gene_type:complete